jgi:RNA polymerase sigma-70 factor (ECF subfamily)
VISESELVSQYRAHVRPLYLYVSRRTGGNRPLTEDVVQETWLRALRDWRRNGLPREPIAWLSKVASNLLASHFRAQKPQAGLDVAQLLEDDTAHAPTREAAATLHLALGKLRPREVRSVRTANSE